MSVDTINIIDITAIDISSDRNKELPNFTSLTKTKPKVLFPNYN